MGESRAMVPKSEIFMQMDVMDQQQIVAAATGAVIEDLVYKVKGKTAISWAGINHISFFMGDIEVDDWVQWDRITMFEDRVYWAATIRARNVKYGLSSLGTAEAPELADTHVVDDKGKWVKNPDGSWEMTLREDPHCRRKALSMAQRNGKRAVIPAAVLEKWLEYFLDLRKGKIVDPPFQPRFVESTQKQPEKKTTEKKPEKKAPNKIQLSLGEVSVDVIVYNLKAINFGEDDVTVSEQDDGFYVEPSKGLTDAEFNRIQGMLENMGVEWLSDSQRWVIWKEDSD